MQEAEHRKLDQPDAVDDFPKGRAEVVKIGRAEVGRYTFPPGWRWSDDVQALAITASGEAVHVSTTSVVTSSSLGTTVRSCLPAPATSPRFRAVTTPGWWGNFPP